MRTNPRLTIVFTLPQMSFLKEESARLGISVAELVRRIIDRHREEAARP